MDSLRIVLILLGVLLVAGIYLREQRKRRQRIERPAPESAEELGLESFRVDSGPAPEESWGEGGFSAREDEAVWVDAPDPLPERPAAAATGEQAPERPPADDETLLLALIVRAPEAQRFGGDAVLAAAKAAGLHFGRNDIFHYYPDAEGVDDEPWFGVANLLEPGTFDLTQLDERETPGLVFFLQLPGPAPAGTLFERMLAVAGQAAVQLGGELCDQDREPLDEQRLGALRERVRRFSARAAQVVEGGA